ncbi:MAG: YciI family protein, partial [Chthoniobacteraceae bacterium]
ENEGKVVTGKMVADGPFVESKEAVGGYFLIRAGSFDEAVALARECPILEYGAAVEVRPIAAVCPTMQRVRETVDAGLEPAVG